ncbi:MAG: ATP-binding cassette domain-containing protein [Oscillospiraceae bacterium]|jgi:ABC-2 type transport system ATP-binding protein|nr:ATP-binding cassette domain-containing protein [Oscillospiraceae bacterium]
MNSIILENVSKSFGDRRILQETNLELEENGIYGFVGANGSGKTVLFKIICGLLRPTTGEVRVNGATLGKDLDFAPDTGILIETPSFIPYESGFRNLKELAAIQKKISAQQVRQAIVRVGLDDKDRKWVGKYSLGMKQRLGLAQAIMEDPALLILDEPFNALDKQGTSQMRQMMLDLRSQGKTILIASHNQKDIDMLCDAVYEIDAGVLSRER